jgi:hypothetical protein
LSFGFGYPFPYIKVHVVIALGTLRGIVTKTPLTLPILDFGFLDYGCEVETSVAMFAGSFRKIRWSDVA